MMEYDDLIYHKKDNVEIVLFEMFFSKILKNINAIAMVLDPEGRIKFASERFFDFFETTENKVADKAWVEVLIPDGKKRAASGLFKILKEDEKLLQFGVPVIRRKSGTSCVLWTALPLSDHDVERMYFFIGAETEKENIKDQASKVVGRREMRRIRDEVAMLLFEAAEKCDPETAKHALRSMSFSERLAREIGLSPKKIENLKTAALLHDLGKLAVNPGVLFKAGKLTTDEFDHIKRHIVWGTDLLGRIYFLTDIVAIMSGHHENYDGRGYPDGIAGEAIPLEARILSVADIYEALTADRPYREAFLLEEAIAIMEYEKGHKLDPRLTDIFLAMIKRDGWVS